MSAAPFRTLPDSREAGGITVFFVLFTVVLAGAVAASLYVGRMVDRKIRLGNAADAAAHAMASHGAMGMNMISANNLAVGANLHVGASVPFIGRYYAILKAYLVSSPIDKPEMLLFSNELTAEKASFDDAFDWTKRLTGHYTKTAAGITSVNVQLGKWWLAPALVKGVEGMRLNEPGSIGVPMQVGGARFASFKYDQLRLSSPPETMCHTIRSSEVLGDSRNRVSLWLGGSLQTLGVPSAAMAPIEFGEDIVHAIDKVMILISVPALGVAVAQTASCVAAVFFHPGCLRAARIAKNIAILATPPVPHFSGCGLSHGGDNAAQFKSFIKDKAEEKNAIGFIFPYVDAGTLEAYEKTLQFAQLVGSPLYLAKELEAQNGACPAEWKFTVGGRTYCSALLDGSDLDRAVAHQMHARLDDVWSRVQWSIGQAEIAYEPNGGQEDAMGADVRKIPSGQKEARANRRSMQLFWPAWRARATETTASANFLGRLGKLGQTP